MSTTDLRARLNAAAPLFGAELAKLAYARGLAVTVADGSTRPISITAAPIVLDDAELARRATLARHLSSAGLKASRAALLDSRLRFTVLGALSPLERELAEQTFTQLQVLATTRVDFLLGSSLRALELNATIPAMQGYSDIAREVFLEVVGRYVGAAEPTIARWQRAHRSNAEALYRALLSGYARLRPGRAPERIAILCRCHDAQITELRYLCSRFQSLGTDASVVHPDQLEDGNEDVRFGGQPYDLIYRHLFVRRLEQPDIEGAAAVARMLAEVNGRRAVVLNPPASQLEVKAVFALLSEAYDDDALATRLALSADELGAIGATVPWTRRLEGEVLLEQVAANADRYVLKRSWDYGGRAVFLGRERGTASFASRVVAAWPNDPPATVLSWPELCQRAAADTRGGGFIVQELVESATEAHVLCHLESQEAAALHVDFSAYASVGLDADPRWGGVCRGATSSIVNIMGGGGVLPLLDTAVADELERAWNAVTHWS